MRYMKLAAFVSASFAVSGTADAQSPVVRMDTIPGPVKTLYEDLCHADYWINNKRILTGSSSDEIPDHTGVFLMVCGDAASSVPYVAIVMMDGKAKEAVFKWSLRGKTVPQGSLDNARFGSGLGVVVSTSHVSATCEKTYTHQWDGEAFQLLSMKRGGCKKGE